MAEVFQPTVVIEGRAPLPNQLVTRQTYLSAALATGDIRTFLVDAGDPDTYDTSGRIRSLDLEPGHYAWRLRDIAWPDGDPSAYTPGHGYNSATARTELATRQGFATALSELGLGEYGIETRPISDLKDPEADELIFIKPNKISDVSEAPGARAQLIKTADFGEQTKESPVSTAIWQRPEPLINAQELIDQLGLTVDIPDSNVDYLHALRVFSPLWLPLSQVPAVELRLTDPHSDIGKQFASQLKLAEPELVFHRLPQLAVLHALVESAFAAKYGRQNYLTFDYVVRQDGSVRVLNGLVRGLTPNLEGQTEDVQHLAKATADVEVTRLASLAMQFASS